MKILMESKDLLTDEIEKELKEKRVKGVEPDHKLEKKMM
jgi:hypothetical protein